jgi:hypothetical protein
MAAVNVPSFEDEFERRALNTTQPWRAPPHQRIGQPLRFDGAGCFGSRHLYALTHRSTATSDFVVSDDGFRTAKKCGLIWRESNFLGVEFVDRVSG